MSANRELLVSSLQTAVLLWVDQLGLPDTLGEHIKDASDLARLIASKGDILMYGGKKGEAAEVFNALAKGIAILSCVPGGVKVFGFQWNNGKCEPIPEGD